MTGTNGTLTTSRRTRLTVAAAVTCIILAAATVVVGRMTASAPVVTTEDFWTPKIYACASTSSLDELATHAHEPDVTACLSSLLVSAAANGQYPAMAAALDRLVEADLRLYTPCHEMMHSAGVQAFTSYPSMAAMIEQSPSAACGYGFIHGGLDAYGSTVPTREDFLRTRAACGSMRDVPGMDGAEGLCLHGLGHSAWLAAGSLAKAAGYCAALGDPNAQAMCGDGIVMAVYEPITGQPARDIADAPAELPALCRDQWPNPDTAGYGCYFGAAYIYLIPAHAFVQDVVGARGRFDHETGTLLPAERAELARLVNTAIDQCEEFTNPDGVGWCKARAAGHIPVAVYWDSRLLDQVCGRLDQSSQACLTARPLF